jgi:hypothetical protein
MLPDGSDGFDSCDLYRGCWRNWRRLGLTTKEIAGRLFIAPKAAEHYIENVYSTF